MREREREGEGEGEKGKQTKPRTWPSDSRDWKTPAISPSREFTTETGMSPPKSTIAATVISVSAPRGSSTTKFETACRVCLLRGKSEYIHAIARLSKYR